MKMKIVAGIVIAFVGGLLVGSKCEKLRGEEELKKNLETAEEINRLQTMTSELLDEMFDTTIEMSDKINRMLDDITPLVVKETNE